MSEEKQIDVDATEELFIQFLNGAVLDGKRYEDVIDPYDYCANIVKSWRQ